MSYAHLKPNISKSLLCFCLPHLVYSVFIYSAAKARNLEIILTAVSFTSKIPKFRRADIENTLYLEPISFSVSLDTSMVFQALKIKSNLWEVQGSSLPAACQLGLQHLCSFLTHPGLQLTKPSSLTGPGTSHLKTLLMLFSLSVFFSPSDPPPSVLSRTPRNAISCERLSLPPVSARSTPLTLLFFLVLFSLPSSLH